MAFRNEKGFRPVAVCVVVDYDAAFDACRVERFAAAVNLIQFVFCELLFGFPYFGLFAEVGEFGAEGP